MIFSSKGQYTIVVEGESDYRLFLQWLIDEDARIRQVDGKDRAVEIWNCAAGKFAGLVCVVDMDYEPIVGSSLVDDERFIYVSGSGGSDGRVVDGIDLEATLIKSSALTKFLINKFRGSDLYSDSLFDKIAQLRERLRISARDVGAVRAADANCFRRSRRTPVGGRLKIDELFFDASEVQMSFEDLSRVLRRSSATGSS
jgi:hypothetical protein